jgi:Uma2 family endonuclease
MGDIIGAITHFAWTEESGDVNFGGVVAFAAIWLLEGPFSRGSWQRCNAALNAPSATLRTVSVENPVMVRLDTTPTTVGKDAVDDTRQLPTNLYSDEPPLETDFHRNQIDLLIRLLKYWWQERSNFYISGNLTVYYNQQQLKQRDFRGPDIFIVLDTENKDRRSWAVWEEGGKYPNVVIELLSNSTATLDRGAKKELYQSVWRVPEYYWFHPETMEFAGFHLVNGRYEAILPTEAGWLWSEQLALYLGIHEHQLRWFTQSGQLIPSPEEQERLAKEQAQQQTQQERLAKEEAQQLAKQAQQQTQQERLAKEKAQQLAQQEQLAREKAQQRLQQLEALLRSQGIDPDQLSDRWGDVH